jgi:cellulase/cellobiase CelA1
MEDRIDPEGTVLLGLSRRCVPKGARAAWNWLKPTTEARGSMEKLEAEAKQFRNFSRPLARTPHCQQTLIKLIP